MKKETRNKAIQRVIQEFMNIHPRLRYDLTDLKKGAMGPVGVIGLKLVIWEDQMKLPDVRSILKDPFSKMLDTVETSKSHALALAIANNFEGYQLFFSGMKDGVFTFFILRQLT